VARREQQWVVVLRAVNVGGTGRMTMADLRSVVHGAGFPDATTHIQSGNLLLGAAGPGPAIEAAIESAIAAELGFSTQAMARTAAQMRTLADASPHPDDADPSRIGIGFCKTRPAAAAVRALAARDFGHDRAEVRGAECVLWYPDGMGRSKMTGAALERVLGVPLTVRNLKVTRALAELASAPPRS